MSNKRKLLRELRKTLDVKQDVPNYISGVLGAVINGEELVAVPGRNGFVYVRMRNSESEFIQAFNESVNNVYGLPVLLEYDKHYYVVVGKDTNRYSQWGSGYGGAQLAAHGDQHSFGEGTNTGIDVVWVYKRQFMPLLVKPSNPFSMSVAVQDDWYQWNNELKHYTGTSIDLTGARPGDGYSRFVTLYVDATTNTVKGVTGSNFDSTNYGASVESYIPTVSQTIGIPVGSVRVDGTGADLRWSNLYDIRSLWTGPSATLVISDDSVIRVTGTAIDFGAGLDVSSTGSVAYVKLNYSGSFIGLTDTPDSYSGQANKYVAVNGAGTALVFVTGTSGGGGSSNAWFPSFIPPNDADFAWINQGSGTVSVFDNKIYLRAPTSASDSVVIRKKSAPATPYTITVGVIPNHHSADYNRTGIGWRESSSGKLILFGLRFYSSGGGRTICLEKFTNPTTFSADYTSVGSAQSGLFYLRLSDDGTTRRASWSADGVNFVQVHQVGRTDFMTADEVMFQCNPVNGSWECGITIVSWEET